MPPARTTVRKAPRKVAPARSRSPLVLWMTTAMAALAGGAWWFSRPASPPKLIPSPAPAYAPRPAGSVTFNKHIAPIVFQECAVCHRPGESGPFNLLTYAEVKKQSAQIAKVTQSRFMPPWLPEEGFGNFAEARRLSVEQLGLIQQWVADGSPEGLAADLPPTPHWTDGWQLGPPDLVVQMPEAYLLPAEGKDVYRHFVIPVPLTGKRHIRAFEFRAGTKVIHHAFIRVDATGQSRRLDAQEPGAGFGGMESPPSAGNPGGHFLSWQPGRRPTKMPDGLSWTLSAPLDLVVQMHMQPSGKPEPVQPRIGFYFTDRAPTNTPFKVSLNSFAIDIPAGTKDYLVQDSYTLPIDVELLGVLPHAHYLARRMEGTATLPDGTRQPLLLIKEWDFNWQSDFTYASPLLLPKGTTLAMRYTYDNSADNVRNPHQPPQRVAYGPQSSDEMGELWLQMLPREQGDVARFEADYQKRVTLEAIEYNTLQLRRNPTNAHAHGQMAKALIYQSKINEALVHLRRCVQLQPNNDEAHYHLGVLALQAKDLPAALAEFQEAIRHNPDYFKAHNNAGLVYLRQNRFDEAERHFNEALRINAEDTMALGNLQLIQQFRSRK